MQTTRNGTRSRLVTSLATTRADVRAAQQLRYRVFHDELGAQLPHTGLGIDHDRFDPWCDHLLVRLGPGGPVVGTYRMLPAAAARRLGGFYAESEFDLGAVRDLPSLVELGRACVDPEWRSGAVIALLWGGLARWLHATGAEHVIGCASIAARHDPQTAAAVCRRLVRDHLAPPELRVAPRVPYVLGTGGGEPPAEVPALVRGYLRLGAHVCGEPAWDPDFGTADLLLHIEVSRLHARYARAHDKAA